MGITVEDKDRAETQLFRSLARRGGTFHESVRPGQRKRIHFLQLPFWHRWIPLIGCSVSPTSSKQPVLGWREWLSLPTLSIPHIKAKVDSGARTSALHTFELETYLSSDGTERVRFYVHPFQNNTETVVECDCAVIGNRSVRDSGGHEQVRPFIRVPVILGPHQWKIEFSLTNRDNMKFRMLLGRTAMENRFLINPALSYEQSKSFRRSAS